MGASTYRPQIFELARQKLWPHSFRSTLDEALDADLLLVIVDAADPHWQEQLEVTRRVLGDVGADKIAHLMLLNKCDPLTQEQLADLTSKLPEALLVSSLREADVARVHQAIVSAIDVQLQPAALCVPYSEGSLISSIHEAAHVRSERFDETGTWLELRAKPEFIAAWKQRLEAHG